MTKLTDALATFEAAMGDFRAIDARVRDYTATVGQAALDAMTDEALDALDAQFGHTAALDSLKAAELVVAAAAFWAEGGKRNEFGKVMAQARRDPKFRIFMVNKAYGIGGKVAA